MCPPSGLPVAEDPSVLDVDPCSELVGEPESIGGAERLQILEDVRWGLVVVSDPEVEGDLQHALNRFRRDPRDRGDRRLDAQRTGYPMGGWTFVMVYPVAPRIVPILRTSARSFSFSCSASVPGPTRVAPSIP
jgi:hypothetical protein